MQLDKRKRFRFIRIGKQEIWLVLIANDNRKPRALIIKIIQTVKEISEVSRYKINNQWLSCTHNRWYNAIYNSKNKDSSSHPHASFLQCVSQTKSLPTCSLVLESLHLWDAWYCCLPGRNCPAHVSCQYLPFQQGNFPSGIDR